MLAASSEVKVPADLQKQKHGGKLKRNGYIDGRSSLEWSPDSDQGQGVVVAVLVIVIARPSMGIAFRTRFGGRVQSKQCGAVGSTEFQCPTWLANRMSESPLAA